MAESHKPAAAATHRLGEHFVPLERARAVKYHETVPPFEVVDAQLMALTAGRRARLAYARGQGTVTVEADEDPGRGDIGRWWEDPEPDVDDLSRAIELAARSVGHPEPDPAHLVALQHLPLVWRFQELLRRPERATHPDEGDDLLRLALTMVLGMCRRASDTCRDRGIDPSPLLQEAETAILRLLASYGKGRDAEA